MMNIQNTPPWSFRLPRTHIPGPNPNLNPEPYPFSKTSLAVTFWRASRPIVAWGRYPRWGRHLNSGSLPQPSLGPQGPTVLGCLSLSHPIPLVHSKFTPSLQTSSSLLLQHQSPCLKDTLQGLSFSILSLQRPRVGVQPLRMGKFGLLPTGCPGPRSFLHPCSQPHWPLLEAGLSAITSSSPSNPPS